jgi:hypothetical protein
VVELKALLLWWKWDQWLRRAHPDTTAATRRPSVSPERATPRALSAGRRPDADRSVRGVNRGARAMSSTCLPAIVRAPSDGDAHRARHRSKRPRWPLARAGRASAATVARRPHPLFLVVVSSPGGASELG